MMSVTQQSCRETHGARVFVSPREKTPRHRSILGHLVTRSSLGKFVICVMVLGHAQLLPAVDAHFLVSRTDKHPCTRLILEEEYIEALPFCKQDLENAEAVQQHNLGYLYLSGLAEVSNAEFGMELVTKAAASSAHAMNTLSHVYENGIGVDADAGKALEWARASAGLMDPEGHYTLGRFSSPAFISLKTTWKRNDGSSLPPNRATATP